MRVIFFGADGWFSSAVLSALLAAGFEVPVVVTKGEDGKKFISSLVHKFDRERKILIVEVKTAEDILKNKMLKMVKTAAMAETAKFSSRSTVQTFNRSNRLFAPDAIVLAAFGPPFLAKEVLKWPKYGCLNVHASLLPRWRGASPVFASLREGDKETGVSIMRMTEEIDRGPVLGQKKTMINQPLIGSGGEARIVRRQALGVTDDRRQTIDETGFATATDTADTRETLTKRLGKLGGELIVETLKKLETGQITEVPQPEKSPTPYTRRLTKESGLIDWRFLPGETSPERSRRIERFIRAATPWPGAWTEYKEKGKRKKVKGNSIKILKANLQFLYPSSFILLPSLVQLPGKNPVSWKQFLAGHPGAEFVQ